MRFVSFQVAGQWRVGVVWNGRVGELARLRPDAEGLFRDMKTMLEAGAPALEKARDAVEKAVASGRVEEWPLLGDVALGPPIPNPGAVYALAANYGSHIEEAGQRVIPKQYQTPQVFMKPASTVIGPGQAILLPGPICQAVDYEGELAVVIGRKCSAVDVDEALEYVAGYMNFNDVSCRSLAVTVQRQQPERYEWIDWLNGKWFDTFAATGPFLVTADEIPDPQALRLRVWVNGELRQDASTSQMIFTCAEAVSWISQFVTLWPGDIIATGTPAGVGETTGEYLRVGDVVEVEIEGLGRLRNPVEERRERPGRTPTFRV